MRRPNVNESSDIARRYGRAVLVTASIVGLAGSVRAEPPPPTPPVVAAPAATPSPPAPAAAAAPPAASVSAAPPDPNAPIAALTPRPVEPKPLDAQGGRRTQLVADPVGDSAVLAITLGFVGVLSLVQSTGELRPQQPSSSSKLLAIDRLAVDQTPSKSMRTLSNFGVAAAGAFAVLDPVLSGRRDGVTTGLIDGIMYAESVAISIGLTNITKMAIRRPRPSAYAQQERLIAAYPDPATRPDITNTDSALSFFSGHTAVPAAIGATATYLAFIRSPEGSWRPWITLAGSTVLTGVTGYARVRAGVHFPTDVIAGALAGAGIGALVPYLHRADSVKARPVWIGFAPETQGRGGTLSASGAF